MYKVALNGQRRHQRVCERPEGPSTAMACSQGFCLGNAALCCQEAQAAFVELMAVVDNNLFLPSRNVVTRGRFGVKKQVPEGQTLCSLHLEQIINYLTLRENILFQHSSR